MNPRDYQLATLKAVKMKLALHHSTLVEMATGLGKTCVFAWLADEWPGRVLVIAHRDELIGQAAKKIHEITGHTVAIEMGREHAEDELFGTKITVASVQTLARASRRHRFHPDHFGLMVIDEGHHGTAVTYREVMNYFASAKRLFVTATPLRADKTALEIVCESVAYQYGIEPAIGDGWLVPVQQVVVKIDDLDFSKARTVADDFNQGDLEKILTEEKPLHAMCASGHELIGNRQALWFATGVIHARAMAGVLGRYATGGVEFLSGDTPKEERREKVAAYKSGQIQHLVNCLDEETEILTAEGWVGIDDMTTAHHVANWSGGAVTFEQPSRIVRRNREPCEQMVFLDTPRRSIRVTEGHRMLYRTNPIGPFHFALAGELVGRAMQLPVSGQADALPVGVEQTASHPVNGARVRANSYVLRKQGMTAVAAKEEAIRRAKSRESLRYKEPAELTLAECEFIGFWIGDGCRGKLSSGGVEYTLAQSPTCPAIVDRVDELVRILGLDVRKRRNKEDDYGDYWSWSFSRGTGFGTQQRRGVYHLEPYLDKDGSHLLWGLNQSQFDAFVRGLWMADGNHGNSITPSGSLNFCGVNRSLFNLIQAVACCRGYLVSLRTQKATAKPHHTPLLRMRLRKEPSHRMVKRLSLQFEEGWKAERVWCVTTRTGTIITRRHGSVTITGQCALFLEGFDAPATSVVVMGRPTKSLGLYMQILGRGTRTLPGVVDGIEGAEQRRTAIAMSPKPSMLVIDYAGNAGKHKIIQATDVLGGKHDAPTRQYAKQTMEQETTAVDIKDALDRAQAELALLAEEESRRKKIVANVQYLAREVSPFARQYQGRVNGQAFKGPAEQISDKWAWKIVYLSRKTTENWTFEKAKRLSHRQAQGVTAKLEKAAR